ncbi:MAG: HAMP domain-containing sensor histidine kinase [Peptococcaceae bacterium]|nr:HAMP domain-containing sensor histidine kinase [Peptococcaceae bacterium]
MNSKKKKFPQALLIFFGILAFCLVLYILYDIFLRGYLMTWFSGRHTDDPLNPYPQNAETVYHIFQPDWYMFQDLILSLCACALILCILTACIVAHFWAKRQCKRNTEYIEEMIGTCLATDADLKSIIPAKYRGISNLLTELQATTKQQQKRLQEETTRKNDMITYLAHDLKTPLTSVVGYLALLKDAPELSPAHQQKFIGIAYDKANRLEALTNELFDITRYNLQAIPLNKTTVNLSYMLEQLVDEFYPLLHAHGNTVALHAEPDIILHCDADQLARVFNNLLKNAISYSFENSTIRIGVQQTAEKTTITFVNQGPTIPPEKLDHIFEKFFRADPSRSTQTGNAGLGLAIAKSIVDAHSGTLTATSENDETSFTITLPNPA